MFRRLLVCVLLAACVFAVQIALWPVLAEVYRTGFEFAGKVLFDTCMPSIGAHLSDYACNGCPPGSVWFCQSDVAIRLEHACPEWPQITTGAFVTGYLPTAIVAALALATPIDWRRRRTIGVLALALVHAYISLRLLLSGAQVLHVHATQCSTDAHWDLWRWSQTKAVLDLLVGRLQSDPNVSTLIPMLAWAAAVSVTRGWGQIAQLEPRESPATGAAGRHALSPR